MFEGLFNKVYNGKKKDLKKEDIPTNLFGMFGDRLGNHLSGIVKVNIFFCIFLLPLFIWTGYSITAAIVAINQTAEITGDILAGDSFRQVMNIFMLGLIPAFAISGPGMAGISYVLKRFARDEHAFVVSDFMDSIKVNWFQSVLMMLLNGIMLNVLWFGNNIYAALLLNVNLVYVLRALMILAVVLCLAVNLYFWPMMVNYKASFGLLLKTSISLMVARLPFSVLFMLLTLLPFGLLLWLTYAWGYGFLVLIGYYLIIGFGLTGFINMFYGNASLDKYIKQDDENA